ncbi:hypothetical protein ABZV68_32255 [Streptomyces clavifer]|uniref:hypothetical protein n=1 Tax=Streptomyces clavifer TaxID=68188 RepID=UPI00339E97C7
MEIRIPGTEELPSPQTSEQRQLLQVVWDVFAARAEWPTFHQVDRQLDRLGLDAVTALRTLPEELVRGFPDPSRPVPSDDGVLSLTIAGAANCRDSADVVRYFLALIRVLAETEQRWGFVPSGDKPSLTARTAASRLGLSTLSTHRLLLQQVRILAQHEPGVQGTHEGDSTEWTLQIDRSIRSFRGVQDIGAYWRARNALRAPYPAATSAPQGLFAEETPADVVTAPGPYVSNELIAAFDTASTRFSLDKLSALARELNANYAAGHPYACQMLLRSILDHIPPAFEQKTFDHVVANRKWSRTDRTYVKKLAEGRASADDALHRQIRKAPSHLNMDDLPPRTWLNALLQVLVDHLRATEQPEPA